MKIKTNAVNNLIVVHDGNVWFPNMEYNQKGFTLEQAENAIKNEGWEDAVIYSVDDEIEKYGLRGNEFHKALLDSETYAFETWWNAYVDRNINITRLPIKVGTNAEYEVDIKIKLDEFFSAINKPAFVYDKNLIDDVSNNIDVVIDIFHGLKKGNRGTAKNLLKDFLKPFIAEGFLVNELDQSYAFRGIAPYQKLRTTGYDKSYEKNLSTRLTFFRMRTKGIGSSTVIESLGDIVHLPYKLAHRATEMRYSRAGYPCLYLGTTSWVCANECRWDKGSQELYGSVFVPNEEGKKLKILNLAISQYLIDGIHHAKSEADRDLRLDLQRAMIKLYPLVLAMSYAIDDSSRSVKYEYLISQCLMDVVLDLGIDGIAYLSAQGEDEFQYPHGVNLALPAYDLRETNQYSKYCNAFYISEPAKFDNQESNRAKSYINEIYTKYRDGRTAGDITSENFSSKIPLNGKMIFYGDTEYGKYDNYLCSQRMMRFVPPICHLFLIGNGFDLEHDYPTSYDHFREYLIKRFPGADENSYIVPSSTQMPDGDEQYDMDEVAGFIIRILDECAGDEWSDLESSLGHDTIRSLMGDLFEVNPEQSDRDTWHAVYNNEDISSDMSQAFRKVIDFFREWIVDYYGDFQYGFHKLIKGRTIDYKDYMAGVLEDADAFLSFNYTETLEKVYGIKDEKICHIHGKVGDNPERLLVGHGEEDGVKESFQTMGADSNLNELKRLLKKDTEDAFDRNVDFFDRVGGGLESIHTFGFSFSDVDLYYIQKIAERTDPSKVTWYINKFDDAKRYGTDWKSIKFKRQVDKVAAMGFNILVDNRW